MRQRAAGSRMPIGLASHCSKMAASDARDATEHSNTKWLQLGGWAWMFRRASFRSTQPPFDAAGAILGYR